jgi:hypothetical protein
MKRNVLSSKHNCILTVCKDAGAANVLSVFLKEWKTRGIKINAYSLCIGHAIDVFRREGVKPTISRRADISRPELARILDKLKPKAILLGTSFDSETERLCVLEARRRNIFCMGYVDWWSNFGRRFSTPNTNDLKYLPDVIGVPDEDARLGCIADRVPNGLIRVVGNPYWDYLKTQAKHTQKLRKDIRKKLNIPKKAIVAAVFSGNVRNLNLNLCYDEHDFWEAITPLPKFSKKGVLICWILKPHPCEDKADTKNLLEKYGVDLLVVDDCSAQEVIAASDFIIGMCSSTLFEAAILGKRVMSLQPNMNAKRLKYLRIFDHISIPKITTVDKIHDVLDRLFNCEIGCPKLKKIPKPLCDGNSNSVLKRLLISGIKKSKC